MDACVVSGQSVRCAQEDAAVAFLPLPSDEIAPGHTLVVPRRHTHAGLLDAHPSDLAQVMDLAQRIAQRMMQRLGATGVCVLNASGPGSGRRAHCGDPDLNQPIAVPSVDHLRVHVVPRYAGDGDDTLPWPVGRSRHRLALDVQAVLRR
jgi:histidine triad (HIT) family protein